MNLAAHLRTLEEHLLQASVRHDSARLAELLSPDFREFGASGRIFTREQIIAELAAEAATTLRTLQDFTLLASTSEWALVTYRSMRQEPAAADVITLRSSTWILREGRWQMLFHQGTIAS